MNPKIETLLEDTVEEIAKKAILNIDVTTIIEEQMKSTVQSIARDMFSDHSDFSKKLESKIKKELSFNIEKIAVPEFGSLILDNVQAELNKIEKKELDNTRAGISKRLNNMFGSSKELRTCKELEEAFVAYVYLELKYSFDDECSCDGEDRDPETVEDIRELLEYNDKNIDIRVVLVERESVYSTFSIYSSHLVFSAEVDNKNLYTLKLIVDRQADKEAGEKYGEYDLFKEGKNNIYKVRDIVINDKPIEEDNTYLVQNLSNRLEEILFSNMINDAMIDMSVYDSLEFESE